jgi:hypothetical protein
MRRQTSGLARFWISATVSTLKWKTGEGIHGR